MKGPSESQNNAVNYSNGYPGEPEDGADSEHKNGEARVGLTIEAPPPEDFSDYMWMANEEEFEQQVLQQLEEEALMEECMLHAYGEQSPNFDSFSPLPQEQMFLYQQMPQQIPFQIPLNFPNWAQPGAEVGASPDMLSMNMMNLALSQTSRTETIMETATTRNTKLNPNAAEFVPRFAAATSFASVSSHSVAESPNT